MEETLIGKRIGHLMIVDELGLGGMGRVYVAFDDRLQREVALKSVRQSRLDEQARARFLYEARILSQLRHPNICTIHGFVEGTDDLADRDFLVLELVQGDSLQTILKGESEIELDDRMRLQIARDLCSGLAAAHARAVVHRDLKPENVMVSLGDDDRLEVKILDFGLARLAADEIELPVATEPTAPADPSSAAGPNEGDRSDGAAGTTRTDELDWIHHESSRVETLHGTVYGTLAFMAPEQLLCRPTTPATDVYSLGLVFQELFTGKAGFPASQSKTLVVRLAQRGPQPVEGVHRDFARLLRDMQSTEPEDRPTMTEVRDRLDRFAGRKRRQLRRLALALVLVLAALGFAKYTADLQHERNAAIAAQEAEEVSRRQAERVVDFLVGLFESSDPTESVDAEELTARAVLARGSRELRSELEDDPEVRARLLAVVGEVQCTLGVHDEAEQLLADAVVEERSLLEAGLGDPASLARALGYFGRCHWEQDDYDLAEPLLEEAMELAQSVGDAELLDDVRNNLALLRWRQARYQEASDLLRQNLDYLDETAGDPQDVARALNNLAETTKGLGDLAEAERLLRKALEIKERVYGADHYELASTLSNLGEVAFRHARYEEAETHLLRSLEIHRRVFGEDHPRQVPLMNTLASVYDEDGRSEKAVDLYLRLRRIVAAERGERHVHIGVLDNNLGETYVGLGRAEEARDCYERSLSIMREALGDDHPHLAYPISGLGQVSQLEGRMDETERYFRLALEQRRKTLDEDHPLVQDLVDALRQLTPPD